MIDNHELSIGANDQLPDYLAADHVFGELGDRDRREVEARMVQDKDFLKEVVEMYGTVELLRAMDRTANIRGLLAVRRLRLTRVAVAASLLIITVGLGGYAAGRGGLTIQALIGTSGQVAPATQGRSATGDAHAKADQSTKEPESQRKSIAKEADATLPRATLAMSHPVTPATFTLKDRGHVLPILPKDPLRPLAHHDWYYPVPAHITELKFSPKSRDLRFKVDQVASPDALDRARKEIAREYQAKGQPGVTPDQINLQPLQRLGYRFAIRTSQGDILLKEHKGGIIYTGEKLPVTGVIPSDWKPLIDELTENSSYVTIVHAGLYSFEFSKFASTEAQRLRSSVLKAIQKVLGGKTPPETGIIVDRQGKEHFRELLWDELAVLSKEYGLQAKPIMDLALKNTDELQPLTFREFLDRPGKLMIWTPERAWEEMRPETYDLLTRKSDDYLKQESELETLSETINDLATHVLDDRDFYRQVQETFKLKGEAGGSYMIFFSASLNMDLAKSYEEQVKTKTTSISDFHRFASDKHALKSAALNESRKKWEGANHIIGTHPKGWDLYRLTDSTVVGESLFLSHQVEVVDVGTVAIQEEFGLNVEPSGDSPIVFELKKELADVNNRLAELTTRHDQDLGELENNARVIQALKAGNEALPALKAEIEALRGKLSPPPPLSVCGNYRYNGGVCKITHLGGNRFRFDNENPNGDFREAVWNPQTQRFEMSDWGPAVYSEECGMIYFWQSKVLWEK
jgi:hypothetical protein